MKATEFLVKLLAARDFFAKKAQGEEDAHLFSHNSNIVDNLTRCLCAATHRKVDYDKTTIDAWESFLNAKSICQRENLSQALMAEILCPLIEADYSSGYLIFASPCYFLKTLYAKKVEAIVESFITPLN